MKIIETSQGSLVYDHVKGIETEEHTLVTGGTGVGKTLCVEQELWSKYENKYTIIHLHDPKENKKNPSYESAFCMFKPIEKYHLDKIKYEGRKPISIPVKFHHPFTKFIPTRQIPETDFFTYPLINIDEDCVNLLLETTEDKTTREMIINVLRNLKPEDNIWNFMLKIEESITRDVKRIGRSEIVKRDPKTLIKSTVMGTTKNIDEIMKSFTRFIDDFYLQPLNFKYNINMKDIILDQNHIHVFYDTYLGDKKSKYFNRLMLIKEIIKTNSTLKHPVLIHIPEFEEMFPNTQDQDYKTMFGMAISKAMKTDFRFNMISSVSDSQGFGGISRQMTRSTIFTKVFIGRITGEQDIDAMKKVYGYDTIVTNTIVGLDSNEFILRGFPTSEYTFDKREQPAIYKSLFPPFCHAEKKYNFMEMLREKNPDMIKNYSELLKEMNTWWKESHSKSEGVLEKENKEIESMKKREEERDKISELKDQLKEKDQVQKDTQKQTRSERDVEIIRLSQEEKLSVRKIADKIGISHVSVSKILKKNKVQEISKENENISG